MTTRSALALVVLGAALLAGCTAGRSGNSSEAAVAPLPNTALPDSAAKGVPPEKNGAAAPSQQIQIVPDQALIRTVDLTVRVDDVAQKARRVTDAARRDGGQVYADERQNDSADITLKIPPDNLDGLLNTVSELGREEARHTTTQDVTQDVADVDSRIDSMKASLARVRTLLGRATAIGDVISLESELAKREADLESLQARQRSLQAQTALATVTVHLRRAEPAAAPPPPPAEQRGGFLGGLSRGWHAFATAAGWLFAALGTVLPFLILLAAAGAGYLLIRTRRPRPELPEV